MTTERMSEFTIMLFLEQLVLNNRDFNDYLHDYYNVDKFNIRYRELLDEFLNDYALNKTEKSE